MAELFKKVVRHLQNSLIPRAKTILTHTQLKNRSALLDPDQNLKKFNQICHLSYEISLPTGLLFLE
jgi:hypothetical protein